MVHALVPLKDLVSAKTRLSGLLRPAERRALAQAMVEDVLTALTGNPGVDRVTLVSDDPGASLLACKYGIDALDEKSLECRGLNAVLNKSCDRLMTSDQEIFLLLHGDLPLLSGADIDAVLELQAASSGLVIGTDLHNQGTNLLAFDSFSRPEFAFGPMSCNKHSESARKLGIKVAVLRRPGIGLDVDQAEDLVLLMNKLRSDGVGYTADLLLHSEMGERIETLTASLDQREWAMIGDGNTL